MDMKDIIAVVIAIAFLGLVVCFVFSWGWGLIKWGWGLIKDRTGRTGRIKETAEGKVEQGPGSAYEAERIKNLVDQEATLKAQRRKLAKKEGSGIKKAAEARKVKYHPDRRPMDKGKLGWDHFEFKKLPKELREVVSSSQAAKIIGELEDKYGIELDALVIKVMVKEVSWPGLANYLVREHHFGQEQAEQLQQEMAEKVFSEVTRYLGITLTPTSPTPDVDGKIFCRGIDYEKELGMIFCPWISDYLTPETILDMSAPPQTPEEVKSAFTKMAAKYHEDKLAEASPEFKEQVSIIFDACVRARDMLVERLLAIIAQEEETFMVFDSGRWRTPWEVLGLEEKEEYTEKEVMAAFRQKSKEYAVDGKTLPDGKTPLPPYHPAALFLKRRQATVNRAKELMNDLRRGK